MEDFKKYPSGFYSFGRNIGIKDTTPDFAVLYCEDICESAAVFTRNNYPGAPVIVGREHIKDGKLQAIVINSKNSNVATGEKGIEDARAMCSELALSLGIQAENVLPSSTGVIGVPLPIDKILPACRSAKQYLKPGNLEEAARAIMTTDTKRKISVKEIEENGVKGVIYGMAKGAGMIEPNMATMLCYIVTDLMPKNGKLYDILKFSVDKSFNCITIDSDTSTSDTVVLMCSGKAGQVSQEIFQEALDEICIDLARQIVSDGEGVTKLIQLDILNARDEIQANRIGKSVLNSPLVKTAIHGGDPNWGRFVMAVGKVFAEKIPYENLSIHIGDLNVKAADTETKKKLSAYLKENFEILVSIDLKSGSTEKRFWGSDLSEAYVQENAFYTT
ncbi:MAG: bifunctional glutamate N-acetyltransferase/amino-acid acetyltransferase ArgJ [Leptospiraceae bacterium]|nr:bifunctional glutamate N-acetyltransferase/amino-acid acetyltransferase ArgJ [Leptospiraceae bacterium]MCP5498358.1 bifunctional glutamate N-acetyltransferase/amino-acid acetyltransferase ArgJ [Leptospiraceae bacterium]